MNSSGKTAEAGEAPAEASASRLTSRILRVCLALAVLAVAVSLAGRWLGTRLAGAGYTASAKQHEIVIGNNVLAVPANAIRFSEARRDGDARRLDLYLRWPDLDGYSEAARDAFNNIGGHKAIVFVSLDENVSLQDMSGRMRVLYRHLIDRDGKEGKSGITRYAFRPGSGYRNEFLAVAQRRGKPPLVARCLSGKQADQSLAPCQRDIVIGDGLRLTYRFSRKLLPQWRALERALRGKMAMFLQTD